MRKNRKQIAIGLGLLLMSVSFFAYQKQADVQAEDTSAICYVAVDNLQEYLGDTATITITNKDESTDTCRTKVPTLEGYVFAGFYAEENETNPISKDSTATSAYAKFVPEEVLSVRGQCREAEELAAVTEDGSSCMRFVTAVDSFSYAQIGFKISIGDNYCVHRYSNTVYDTLYGVGETSENGTIDEEYKPSTEFHEEAKYFKTWTYTEIPYKNFKTTMTVTPFWITKDGSIVYGTEKAGCYVNQGLGEAYNATQGTYGALTTLIGSAVAGDEIRVQRDMELATSATTSIAKTLTITTDGYERVIACKPTAGRLFTITSGTTTIQGASEEAQLIFDGENHIQPAATIYSNQSTVTINMQYVTMRNINSTVGTACGAVRVANLAGFTINECTFENCSQAGAGGAVYAQVGDALIKNCNFIGCESDSNGGAISNYRIANIEKTTFLNCKAGDNGGAIYNGSNYALNITDCVFSGNEASLSGGAIGQALTYKKTTLYYDTTLTLLGNCTFSGNIAKGHSEGFAGGAIMAPSTLVIGDGETATNIQMLDNQCGKTYGKAICIHRGYQTDTPVEYTFTISDNASLNIYNEDTTEDAYVCTIYTGTDKAVNTTNITPTDGNYSITAPTTE